MGRIKPAAIVLDQQNQQVALHAKIEIDVRTSRVAHDVVNTLFENQKDLTPHIGAEIQFAAYVWRLKLKVNTARSQHIAGKATHSLRQVGQAIFMGIDGPNDITHRTHQLRGTRRDT